MSAFSFSGTISASKSLLNRLLIVQSYFPNLRILGDSDCDDVLLMKSALGAIFAGQPAECGHAGTVLRFLALRASRLTGQHVLNGSDRLFSRPQSELMPILGQVGVDAQISGSSMRINSRGWRLVVDGLQVNAERSSQFASAVLLNSWGLKFPLHVNIPRKMVSEGYLRMTVQLLKDLGMRLEENGSEYFIPANQSPNIYEYRAEIDLSSAFAVAAMAVVAGEARIQNFPKRSLQPDSIFVKLLTSMGAAVQIQGTDLLIKKAESLIGLNVNIESSPDLFPVLAVLCALAKTPSEIKGVGHLQYKESSRLQKTKELLEIMGAQVNESGQSVVIEPVKTRPNFDSVVVFNVDQDHRMAMAATVAKWAGYPIQASDMKSVSKSFPEFLQIVEASI